MKYALHYHSPGCEQPRFYVVSGHHNRSGIPRVLYYISRLKPSEASEKNIPSAKLALLDFSVNVCF